jgi:hypothetical protein
MVSSQTHLGCWYKRVNSRIGQTQTVAVRVGHRRGGLEGVEEGAGIIKTRETLKRITPRSVIKLSSRQRCARTGSSLMANSVAMATNANSLMETLR